MADKILKGTFRPDRHAPLAEAPAEAPQPPEWLGEEARRYWIDIAPQLEKVGMIALVDTAAFAAHCDAMGRFIEITRLLKRPEDLITTSRTGYVAASGLSTVRNKLWGQVVDSAKQFGLTPIARRARPTGSLNDTGKDGWGDI